MSGVRPGPGEDLRAWTASVFAAGDYAGAAMFGDPATWEHKAARAIVIGGTADVAALAEQSETEARLHLGAARWIHGDDEGALKVLDATPLPHAGNLARLIRQERIQVLAQLPWLRGTANDLLTAAASDPRFEVRNVSYHQDDVGNHPYADVHRFLDADFAPDFYLCAMVEWHHLPPNLQALPCPILGHIADHDLHIQTLQPWLSLFDELVVTDRTEWLDVQGLAPRATVSSFPKVFGLPADLGPIPATTRSLDFFVSGTMLDDFHPDKALRMHELLSIPDIDLRVVRGHIGTEAYRALLAASVASFTFVRRPGALPTRGLESLAMGCAVATQEESIWNLWVSANEGVVTYGPETGSLSNAVRRILADREGYGLAARRGAEVVRDEFDLRRVASQYLRYMTFRAARERSPRALVDTTTMVQKRICVRRTWLPDSPVARRRTMQANFAFLGRQVAIRPSASLISDMARELIAEYGWYEHHGQAGDEEKALLDDGVQLLEKGVKACPDDLVLRFNLVRTSLHHGSPQARAGALQLAFDTLDADRHWRVAATDDVMPFDFHSSCFNYRDYLTLITRTSRGEAIDDSQLPRLILAALAGYLARKTGKIELHERAAELDPGFARYRLDLADALLRLDDAAATRRATELLTALAGGSVVFPEACERLEALRERGEHAQGGGLPLRRLQEDAIDTRVAVKSLAAAERRAPKRAQQAKMAIPRVSARLTVNVPLAGSGRELSALLAGLELQTLAAELEVVIAVPPADRDVQTMLEAYRDSACKLRCVEVQADARLPERLNACARAASAPLLTIAMPGDRFRADAFELLVTELDDDCEAIIAVASEGWTEHEVSDFRSDLVVAMAARPSFSRRRQFASDCIGMHPVWRRELHDRYGWFDESLGAASEYDFWLRTSAGAVVRQRRELLSSSPLAAEWRPDRDVAARPAELDRARRARWPAENGPLPDLRPQRLLPSVLFTPAMTEEAEVHARLGIMTLEASRQVRQTEEFYGTALMHGDTDTAVLMLRSCLAQNPSLLSVRLALVRLLETLGSAEAGDVLRNGLTTDPYTEQVRRHLEHRGISDAAASLPMSSEFVLPCPR